MKNRIKLPSVGGFNARRGSIQALRPQTKAQNALKTVQIPLTEWEASNNFTRAQSRRLIRQNKLFATKHHGRWWVHVNPNCEEHITDF
ncbi:MAG: hypothetical protein AAF652_13765 [Cyanobacteria bacterium P01_C01_bin.72]